MAKGFSISSHRLCHRIKGGSSRSTRAKWTGPLNNERGELYRPGLNIIKLEVADGWLNSQLLQTPRSNVLILRDYKAAKAVASDQNTRYCVFIDNS